MAEPRQDPLRNCPFCSSSDLEVREISEHPDPVMLRHRDVDDPPLDAYVCCRQCLGAGPIAAWKQPGDAPKLIAAQLWNRRVT